MSKYLIKLNGKEYEMEVELVEEKNTNISSIKHNETKTTWKSGKKVDRSNPNVQVIDPVAEKTVANATNTVSSPMPGTILKVNAINGEKVKVGQSILTLEAMKMENEITAPKDGIIAKLNLQEGQTVAGGEFLFDIE